MNKEYSIPFGLKFAEMSPDVIGPELYYDNDLGITNIETAHGIQPYVEWSWESLSGTTTRSNDTDAPSGETITSTRSVESSD